MQVNTTIARHNVEDVDAIAELLDGFDIELWSVFFLVPTGRGLAEQRIAPIQYEQVFEKLLQQSAKRRYRIKTTEAPHYRRFIANSSGGGAAASVESLGTNDGKGVMFISHVGEISPAAFFPSTAAPSPATPSSTPTPSPHASQTAQPRRSSKANVANATIATFCGGSRARAYALTGRMMAAEPDCVYYGMAGPLWILYRLPIHSRSADSRLNRTAGRFCRQS